MGPVPAFLKSVRKAIALMPHGRICSISHVKQQRAEYLIVRPAALTALVLRSGGLYDFASDVIFR